MPQSVGIMVSAEFTSIRLVDGEAACSAKASSHVGATASRAAA
jgi:hypothetical protein